MAKEVCVKAGKAAGAVVRETAGVTVSIRKGSAAIGQTVVSTVKATGQAMQEVALKLGNLCSRVRTDSKLAYWETKQKEAFGKFGQEIFGLIETNVPAVFEEQKVKELLEEIRSCEKEIQSIKDEMAAQKQKIEIAMTMKRAESDLKSQDPRIRRVAIRILERIGNKDVLPHLTNALNDPDKEVRTRAAEVIHKLVNVARESEQKDPEEIKTPPETDPGATQPQNT